MKTYSFQIYQQMQLEVDANMNVKMSLLEVVEATFANQCHSLYHMKTSIRTGLPAFFCHLNQVEFHFDHHIWIIFSKLDNNVVPINHNYHKRKLLIDMIMIMTMLPKITSRWLENWLNFLQGQLFCSVLSKLNLQS